MRVSINGRRTNKKLLQGKCTIFFAYWDNPIKFEILIFHDTARVTAVVRLLSK